MTLVLFIQFAVCALPAQSDEPLGRSFSEPAAQSAICNPQSGVTLGDSLLKHGFADEAAREFSRVLWEDWGQSHGGDATTERREERVADVSPAPASDGPGAPWERAARDSPRFAAGLTRLKLGLSLAASGQLTAAAQELSTAGRLDPDLAEPAQMTLAGYYAHRGRYDLAAFELSDLLVFTSDSARRAEFNSAVGWLRLQEGDVISAASSYDLAGRHDVANTLRLARDDGHRSPTLAAVLSSLVPGSGEIYAGRTGPGLLAFAVTAGSLVWAIVAAKESDWMSASVIVSTLFWRFYNGSRANAVAFADRYNQAARQRRIAGLSGQLAVPDWYHQTDSLLGYKVRPDTAADGGTE
jgi:TM2 domain-containing membrane protein YozV